MMKKIYLFLTMVCWGVASLFAQSGTDIQFVYINAAGEETGVVADNAVITVSQVVSDPDDEFADPFISSGLAIKNVCANGRRVQLEYEIKTLPNGRHDICFFGTCLSDSKIGKQTYPRMSSKGNIIGLNALKAGSVTPLQAEWYFTEDGTATVVYKANVCVASGEVEDGVNPIYTVAAEGPTVTVNYVKDDTGIDDVMIENPIATEYYNLAGCRVATPEKGIYIVRNIYSGGKTTTKKAVF
ncbi:MAG: hypothetical protein ACI30R_03435 [Sodaliphilus sp.]